MAVRTGLVVAGAGARGAYEAGALSVLVPHLAAQQSSPAVLVGTSAGAINVVGLAGLAHLPADAAAAQLAALWRDVTVDGVLRSVPSVLQDAVRYGGQLLGLPVRLPSLLDTTPQRRTLSRLLPLDRLHENVATGPVDAVAVATTSAATGRTVVFVEKKPHLPLPADDARRGIAYVETQLTVEHVLASAAVPVAFRPVRVTTPASHTGWYLDGGVRLNVPLKPALDLGCDRLGVVATTPATWPPQQSFAGPEPDVFRAASVALQALLGDRMVEDLRTLSAVNALVAAGGREAAYRHVPFVFAGPPPGAAGAVGALAEAAFHEAYGGLRAVRNPTMWALDRLVGGDRPDHGDLLSFLFFDRAFTAPAVDLGAEHARAAVAAGWRSGLPGPALDGGRAASG